MTTKTKKKEQEAWTIPAHLQEEIKPLSAAKIEFEIRTKCAMKRMERAINEGDADTALHERATSLEFQRKHKQAHDALWEAIHEAIPELDHEAKYEYDAEDFEVTVDTDSPLSGLARMFGRDDD